MHWLWPDYLPLGKLTILGGAPGIGKTSVALSAAATTTVERSAWPDGSVNLAARDVLLWSAEDGIEDTLVPKLLAAGADMERVHFVRGVFDHHGHRAFDPSTDMDMLVEAAAAIPELGLILVEPLVLAVSGNSDRNGDVRRGLAPLAEMAERLGVVVLGITHFSKGTSGRDPVERVTGSIAFGAAARLVLVGVRRADEGDFALLRAKSNVGPTDGGFSYRLERVPVPGFDGLAANAVTWTGAIAGIARDILSDAEGDLDSMRGEKLGDAVMFLRDLLVDGPQTYQQVMSDARAAGYSEATIKRARSKLGVVAEKGEGPRAGWRLALPKQDHTMGLSS